MNDNKMNINSLLEEFVSSNLSPTESERKEVSAKYDELSSILKGRNFISGSYGRFTSITPLHDVDVIWELPEETVTNNIRKSIDKKGAEQFTLSFPKNGYRNISVSDKYTDSFCNWTMYKIAQYLEGNNTNIQFIHIAKNDLQDLNAYLESL